MTKIEAVTDVSPIRSLWRRVFSSNDPFTWPFRDGTESGRIFYPTDGCHLTEVQYAAIVAAAQNIGEGSFVLSIVESEGMSFLDRDWGHWKCELPQYREYSSLNLTLENALYSMDGNWGVLISHEMHALVGGSGSFIAALDRSYKTWTKDLELLRETWSDNVRVEWLDEVIEAMPT